MNNRYFMTGLFLFVAFWVVYLYKPFLMTITIASLLSIATYNLNTKIKEFTKSEILAAALSTLLLSILLFGPILYTLNSLALSVNTFDGSYMEKISSYISSLNFELPKSLDFIEPKIDEMLASFNATQISKQAISYATSIGKSSAGFLKDMFLILVFYFFVNLYGYELSNYLKSAVPMEERDINIIFFEVANVMSVVFYSILLTAMFEGMLFAIIGIIYGYDGLLLGILYGFASLIPIVGGALMWIPLSLYELSLGHTSAAIFIILYSIIVISIIADTFIKPMIIKYINQKFVRIPTKINELLIFFSILAGLSSFGFWGMVLGPAITTLFISLLKLFKLLKSKVKQKEIIG